METFLYKNFLILRFVITQTVPKEEVTCCNLIALMSIDLIQNSNLLETWIQNSNFFLKEPDTSVPLIFLTSKHSLLLTRENM